MPTLDEVLVESAKSYLRNSAKAFLIGEQSFQWITNLISRFGFSKETTSKTLQPLRNCGEPFRAEALFNWMAKAEW